MSLWQSCLLFLAFSAVGAVPREAADEEFPFQVSIKSTDKRHLCGGAIITSKWILSVASCLDRYDSVLVGYGSADGNGPKAIVRSKRIERENRLALIELENDIEFSKTASQAKLPTHNAQLRNMTKLSGWNVERFADVPPSLSVIDRYLVVAKHCRKVTGIPVSLAIDEFCGMDEELQNPLTNSGTIVSKSAVVLGILPRDSLSPSEPLIFVKLSEREQWIKDTMGNDANYISWVDNVPKDSAPSQYVNLTLLGISFAFLRLF